jgi:tetratricopeptide (TPR) repeat protein
VLTPNPEDAPARWPAFHSREAVLRDLERAMRETPEALDTRFYYASFLRDHGRFGEALAMFENVLTVAPEHVETLVAYGVLLARRGRRLEARAVFERAVAADGEHNAALANLANLVALDEPERAAALYHAILARDGSFVPAHRGLCSLNAALGNIGATAVHRAAGYAAGPFGRRPYTGATLPISVVALVSTDGGNIPLDALLDERVFLVHEIYVEAYRGEALPPHELMVNAIADADRGSEALLCAAEIAQHAKSNVVNAPYVVAVTGRIANAERLALLDDIVVPAARIFARDAQPAPAFPLIVRAPGLHMGRGMVRADDRQALTAALRALPPRDDLIAIDYLETRSPDGAWRKYRVMAIDGVLYPLHLAIAHRWDVHYFSSEMFDRADYRAEEERFLADPRSTLGARAWDALGRVRDELDLDYAGIDFALDADGRIVVFEANAAMTPLRPDDDPRFAYRRAAADAVGAALERMFRERSA